MSVFSDNMRAVREARGLTLDALAERIGTSKQVLSRYETGHRMPKLPMAEKIAAALNVPLNELSGEDGGEQSISEVLSGKTLEARIISRGVDSMPPEERQRAVQMMKLAFAKYANQFNERIDEDDVQS